MSARALCIRNQPQTSSVVFLKSVGMELGLFDESRKYGEDIQFYQKFLCKDSYYILAERLTELEIGKRYKFESGLSSNLREMHRGRNENTRELYEMGLISLQFMAVMMVLNQVKYVRRCVQKRAADLKFRRIFG